MNENRESVFVKGNPFKRDVKTKGFYYPSNEKENTRNNNKNEKTNQPQDLSISNALQLVDAIEESLSSNHLQDLHELPKDISASSSSKYDESWSSTVQSFHETPTKTLSPIRSKQKEHSVEDYLERQGTLSKFVERFRQQPPLSREEREESTETDIVANDFWWLQQSRPSSFTVSNKDESSTDIDVTSTQPKSTSRSSKNQTFSSSTQCFDDQSIQSRANKLLELSSTLKDSNSSTTLSRVQNTYEESLLKKVQPAINNPWLGGRGGDQKIRFSKHAKNLDVVRKAIKPENDILYQWRLARKMEIAAGAVFKEKQPFIANRQLTEDYAVIGVGGVVEKPVREKHLVKNDCDESEETKVGKQDKYIQESMHQKCDFDVDYHREFLRNNRHLTNAITCCSANKRDTFSAESCKSCSQSHNICPQTPQSASGTHTHCFYGCLLQHQHHQEYKPRHQQETPPENKSTGTQVSLKHDQKPEDAVEKSYKEVSKEENPLIEREMKALNEGTAPIIKQVISQHLFPDDLDSNSSDDKGALSPVLKPTILTPVPPSNVDRSRHTNTPPPSLSPIQTLFEKNSECGGNGNEVQSRDVLQESSSEDEFESDDILRDFRNRRREIKRKLRDFQMVLGTEKCF